MLSWPTVAELVIHNYYFDLGGVGGFDEDEAGGRGDSLTVMVRGTRQRPVFPPPPRWLVDRDPLHPSQPGQARAADRYPSHERQLNVARSAMAQAPDPWWLARVKLSKGFRMISRAA